MQVVDWCSGSSFRVLSMFRDCLPFPPNHGAFAERVQATGTGSRSGTSSDVGRHEGKNLNAKMSILSVLKEGVTL